MMAWFTWVAIVTTMGTKQRKRVKIKQEREREREMQKREKDTLHLCVANNRYHQAKNLTERGGRENIITNKFQLYSTKRKRKK